MIYKIPQHKTIYIIPRKVASTAIRNAIGLSIGEDITQKWGEKYRAQIKDNPDNYKIIGFVWNPYDRLVSCYHNQCLGEDRYKLGECDFERFVQYVTYTHHLDADKHFMRYWDFMADYPDKVIKYENLEEEWPSLGLPSLEKTNVSDRVNWEKYYEDDYILDKVYYWYEKDFITYGYER